jgi:GTPase SAR1 family protein
LDRVIRLQLLGSFGDSELRGKPLLPSAAQGWLLDHLHRLNALRALEIFYLSLGDMPDTIAGLVALRSLSVVRCGLKSLPRWLKQWPLTQLDLGGNIFSALPDWLNELSQLESLDLSGNERLRELPEALFDLPRLKVLRLQGCPVREMPRASLRLLTLERLDIDALQLESPPPEVASGGLDAMRDYWRQRDEAGIDYLCEAKLIILGESGAGKSTLARKIENPAYVIDPQEMSTEGIDIVRYQFPTTIQVRAEDTPAASARPPKTVQRDFQVSIWDFGGQEIYHATHQFFLTRRSVYLLVCDDRKEDTDFSFWLQAVEALSDGSPLLIVQNEKQDRSRDIGLGALRARFPNLRGALATNLASNRGLQTVLDAIRQELQGLPHVGTPLPATWKRVREALEQDPRDTLPFPEYLALCERHGFTRQEDKLMLSRYLHDLGICLHFQDDPVLKHTIVLEPSWGTDAVYRVLDDPEVKAARGRFDRSALARIWCERKYQGMQDELLRLMAKFQLCYALDDSGQAWMAPQLLAIVDDQVERLNRGFARLQVERWLPCPCSECRDKPEPEAFGLAKLTKMATKGLAIQCHESGEMVDAAGLLREVLPSALAGQGKAEGSGQGSGQGSGHWQGGPLRPPGTARPDAAPQVFVSYATGGDSDRLVDALEAALAQDGIRLLRDRKVLGYKDSVGDFMQRIAAGHCVVAVISKKYLLSEYCMTELVGLLKAQRLRERIFPIVLPDAQLYRATECLAYVEFWESESAKLDAGLKRVRGDNLARLQAKLTDYSEFRRLFDTLTDDVRDMNALTPQEHLASGFAALRQAVLRQLGSFPGLNS